RAPVRIKDKNMVRQLLLRSVQENAAEWGDAYAASQNHCSPRLVVMKPQIAEWAFYFHVGAYGNTSQHSLERCVSHTGRHHDEVLIGCTRDRETSRIAFGICFRRILQGNIDELARSEFEAGRLFKAERHGALSYFLPITEF